MCYWPDQADCDQVDFNAPSYWNDYFDICDTYFIYHCVCDYYNWPGAGCDLGYYDVQLFFFDNDDDEDCWLSPLEITYFVEDGEVWP